MRSSYYSNSISNFKKDNPQLILGSLSENHNYSLEDLQKNAWIKQTNNLSDRDLGLAKEELGDIMIYLIRLCDKLDIDLEQAVADKMKINVDKYPIELSKGNSTKYNKR